MRTIMVTRLFQSNKKEHLLNSSLHIYQQNNDKRYHNDIEYIYAHSNGDSAISNKKEHLLNSSLHTYQQNNDERHYKDCLNSRSNRVNSIPLTLALFMKNTTS